MIINSATAGSKCMHHGESMDWPPLGMKNSRMFNAAPLVRATSKSDVINGNMVKYESNNGINIDGHRSTIQESDLIRLNVCGMVYETLEKTLKRFPKTLLGNADKRAKHFLKSRNCYFFDRNRQAFEAILFYYQSEGILLRPPNVPMVLFAEEVAFFELGEEVFVKLQEDEGYIQDVQRSLPKREWQRRIWNLFEHPDTSRAARALAIWSVFVIVFSISIFCLETLDWRREASSQQLKQTRTVNATTAPSMTAHSDVDDLRFKEPWFTLELACIIWFTFEYVMRLVSSPCPWVFVKSFLNIIDLLAVLPYFITLSIGTGRTAPLSVLRVVRLVRVFRIFKLSRHSLGLRILGHTLRASVSELGMLFFFLMLGVILFSSAIFYAEQGSNGGQFPSIPDTFWYSLVTMTTVGYGDKVPKTPIGKVIGSMCAIVGVLMIALPVPVIVSNFEFFYKRDRMSYERSKCVGGETLPKKDSTVKTTSFNNYTQESLLQNIS